jgi:hypothetical protein
MSLRPLVASCRFRSRVFTSRDEGQSDREGVPPEIERGTRAVVTVPEVPRDDARVARRAFAGHEGDDDVDGLSVKVLPTRP